MAYCAIIITDSDNAIVNISMSTEIVVPLETFI